MLNLWGVFLYGHSMFLPSYTKPALDIPAQLFLLESRGLGIEDVAFARRALENVSYYRFSAYLYPFRRKDGSDGFIPGTTFNQCWQYYRFDRRLRVCVLDAIERVEVAVRTRIANHLSLKYGPFAYRDPSVYADSVNETRFNELLTFIDTETRKSKEDFVEHFRQTYDTSNGLPLWMAVEVMTFGNVLTLFRLMKKQDKQAIAKSLGSNEHVFESWLTHLNYIRNICAHHGRLWNRKYAVNPLIPSKDPKWHEADFPVNATRIYSTLCILKTLLDVVAPQSRWRQRFCTLLAEFPCIHRISMGIPDGFENSAIWK